MLQKHLCERERVEASEEGPACVFDVDVCLRQEMPSVREASGTASRRFRWLVAAGVGWVVDEAGLARVNFPGVFIEPPVLVSCLR